MRISDYFTGPGIKASIQGGTFGHKDVISIEFEVLDENSKKLHLKSCSFVEFKRPTTTSESFYLFLQCHEYPMKDRWSKFNKINVCLQIAFVTVSMRTRKDKNKLLESPNVVYCFKQRKSYRRIDFIEHSRLIVRQLDRL